MFVRQSTYDEMVVHATHYYTKYKHLLTEWNEMVPKYNQLLKEREQQGLKPSPPTQSSQLSEQDIKRLLQLVHPDKHNNSKLSTEMTTILLKMRK